MQFFIFFLINPAFGCNNKLLDHNFRRLAASETVNLCEAYSGKVLLVVNTASKCGYTPQYDGLQKVHLQYQPQGFTVLAVPSGDFLGQEFGSNKEISTFCQTKFGIRFPMAEKGHVVGPEAIPIYRWAAARLGADNTPRWNFHKYLIGRDGQLIAAFATKIEPTDPVVTSAIEAALKAPAPKG